MWDEDVQARKRHGDSDGYNSGKLDEEWDKLDAAEQAFRRAAKAGHRMACHELVALLERRGDLDSAEQALLEYDNLNAYDTPGDSPEVELLAIIALQLDAISGPAATCRLGLINGLYFQFGSSDDLDIRPNFELARKRARAYLSCAAKRGYGGAAAILEIDARDTDRPRDYKVFHREMKRLLVSEIKRLSDQRSG